MLYIYIWYRRLAASRCTEIQGICHDILHQLMQSQSGAMGVPRIHHVINKAVDLCWQTSFSSTTGALTSFGVICKTIAHSIQNCLLYLLAKI